MRSALIYGFVLFLVLSLASIANAGCRSYRTHRPSIYSNYVYRCVPVYRHYHRLPHYYRLPHRHYHRHYRHYHHRHYHRHYHRRPTTGFSFGFSFRR